MSPSRRASFALAGFALALFGPAAALCGLYLDDYTFFLAYDGASLARLWDEFVHYVPGRNLHVPFFALLLRLCGSSPALLHLVSAAFDAGLAVLAYRLASRLSGSRATALVAAAAFLAAPNHGETHFWITLVAQCQIPAALALGAFLLAVSPHGPRLEAAAALFALALFTYDQVFLLWPLLLVAAWRADPHRAPRRYATAAAFFCALDAAHLLLRYLSPYASGGRPLIRAADVVGRARDAASAIAMGLFPWPSRSHAHWGWTVLAAVAGLAAAWWVVRELRRGDDAARDWRIPFLFGVAWTVLAYGPNLFWYISPRHNLLPSFGWTLALAAAGGELWRRRAGARPALLAAGVVAFGLGVVANAHEATQWIDAARLKNAFADEVRRLPRPLTAVFTLDAPRRLRRAPAFNLYHDVALAAGRAVGAAPPQGDYSPTPTGNGFVFFNDLSVHPPDAFHWLPASTADVLVFDPAARTFSCAQALELDLPGGGTRRLDLRAAPGCAARPRVPLEAALRESVAFAPAPASATAPRAGGLALLGAGLTQGEGVTELVLEWRVEDPALPALAIVPRGLDVVFARRAGRGSYPVLWPLVDDAAKNLGLRAGQGLRQRFVLRRALTAPAGLLELDVYALAAGQAARPLGRVATRVSSRRE